MPLPIRRADYFDQRDGKSSPPLQSEYGTCPEVRMLFAFPISSSRLVAVPAGALVDMVGLTPVITVFGALVIVVHLGAAILHAPVRSLR